MDYVLAPTQMYILLAVVAIVANVVAAFLVYLFPRRLPDGSIISEKTLASDRWAIRRRRQTVLGAVALFAFVWLNVVVLMMDLIEEWTGYHLLHFFGLMFFFGLQMIFLKSLTDRLAVETMNLLPRPSVTINSTADASSTEKTSTER